jgi:antitoxin MazE
MHVRKLGERLFVELPAEVVERLRLKDGDDVLVDVAEDGTIRLHADDRRARALAALAELGARATPLPAGYRFDRDEANER